VICPDGAGGAFIVWEDYRYDAMSGVDLYAQHLGPTGERLWEDDLEICRATGDQTEPCIVPDGEGGFYVAWVDERVDTAGDIYAVRIDSDGGVHTGWSNYGNVVSEEDPDNHTHDDPCICAVPTGGVVIAFRWYRGATGSDIYAQRMSAAGIAMWAANGVAVSDANLNQTEPVIAWCEGGSQPGPMVAWSEDNPAAGSNDDIYAKKLKLSDGSAANAGWGADGNPVYDDSTGDDYQQQDQRIIADGSGGAIIAWESIDSPDDRVCAQKLDEDGVAQWADVEICDAVGDQQDPVLVTDGAGGAIIAWVDQRIDGGDIYAQKVDAGGSLLWGPLPRAVNGQPVCNIPGVQEDPVAVEDGNGGAFFAWEDSRSGSYDIYTQRMSNLGLADYADDGVALVAAPHDQRSIYASRGESGQALICWEDTRVDVFQDIFAQLISSAAPDVTSITPSSGQAGSTVSITDLAGTGFDTSGVSVVLKKSGEADIAATGETVVSSNRVTCDFDLTGAEPGVWDVYLENDMDGQGDTLAGAFTVTEPLPTTNTWYLAEGCTGAGFETWVLVQNPEATDVTVDLTFMTGSGPQNGPQDFRIAANSRHSFLLNDYVTDWDVSTKVTSEGGNVICERAMYGNARTWAHDSIGHPSK